MNIKIFGFEGPISHLSAVKHEFERHGHILVDSGPVDLIFHMTGFFDKAIEYYQKESPKAFKIFNLLDANPFDPNWPAERVRNELLQADVMTTISHTARDQIAKRTGLIDFHIIGHPILPTIKNLNFLKGIEFAWVGRITGTKRFHLVLQTLETLGVDPNTLAVVGPEKPPCGVYIGTLDPETLNEFYNSSRFVFLTSISEGLGLSAIEACCSGGFPIVCKDNPVVYELGLTAFAADPNPKALAAKVNEIFTNMSEYQELSNTLGKKFSKQFSVETFVENVLSLYNMRK